MAKKTKVLQNAPSSKNLKKTPLNETRSEDLLKKRSRKQQVSANAISEKNALEMLCDGANEELNDSNIKGHISEKLSNKNIKDTLRKKIVSQNKNLASKKISVAKRKVYPIETKTSHPVPVLVDTTNKKLKKKLLDLVKSCCRQYASLNSNEDVPETLHEMERDLQDCLLLIHEQTESFSLFLDTIYNENILNIEEKARLREFVVRLFSCIYYNTHSNISKEGPCVIDAYGLPVVGSLHQLEMLKKDKTIKSVMENSAISCGYFDKNSDVHVLMDYPLEIKAFSDPSVLSALTTMYSEVVLQNDIDPVVKDEVLSSFLSTIQPYRVTNDSTAFIIPCVRLWRGSYKEYRNLKEICSSWNSIDLSERMASQNLWHTFVFEKIAQSHIRKGSLLIRPPSPPLVAQAQTLAWDLTQQVYERLGDAAFVEINFVTVDDNTLALRAYNFKKKLIAQSDLVPLFDVITSPDDFSLLLKEECDADGPYSLMSELRR